MKNIFENNSSILIDTSFINIPRLDTFMPTEMIILEREIEEESNLIFPGPKEIDPSLIEKELSQRINSDLQVQIEQIFDSKKNFDEFKLNEIAKEISPHSAYRSKITSFRAECSFVFYNMLIVSQTKQICLKQNNPFNKFYLMKIN